MPGLLLPRPIPLKERASLVFLERAQIDVLDGAFVVVDAEGGRTHLPIGDLPRPVPPPEALGPAFDDPVGLADDGHRG